MGARHPIGIFPSTIDRDYFGAWISGFVDGEGCFFLATRKDYRDMHVYPCAAFSIGMRADDVGCLKLIQAYWKCGRCEPQPQRENKDHNRAVHFSITAVKDLCSIVIPHFEKYPLLAKKKRDFHLWKIGILFMKKVLDRKVHGSGKVGKTGGFLPKWSKEETAYIVSIRDAIREQRKFMSETISPPEPPPPNPLYSET